MLSEHLPMLIQFLCLVFICIVTVVHDAKLKKENESLKEDNRKLSSDMIRVMQENIELKNKLNADTR